MRKEDEQEKKKNKKKMQKKKEEKERETHTHLEAVAGDGVWNDQDSAADVLGAHVLQDRVQVLDGYLGLQLEEAHDGVGGVIVVPSEHGQTLVPAGKKEGKKGCTQGKRE